jgi:hypothetical protein
MERFWTSLIASEAVISGGPEGAPAKEGKAQSHPLRQKLRLESLA